MRIDKKIVSLLGFDVFVFAKQEEGQKVIGYRVENETLEFMTYQNCKNEDDQVEKYHEIIANQENAAFSALTICCNRIKQDYPEEFELFLKMYDHHLDKIPKEMARVVMEQALGDEDLADKFKSILSVFLLNLDLVAIMGKETSD